MQAEVGDVDIEWEVVRRHEPEAPPRLANSMKTAAETLDERHKAEQADGGAAERADKSFGCLTARRTKENLRQKGSVSKSYVKKQERRTRAK